MKGTGGQMFLHLWLSYTLRSVSKVNKETTRTRQCFITENDKENFPIYIFCRTTPPYDGMKPPFVLTFEKPSNAMLRDET